MANKKQTRSMSSAPDLKQIWIDEIDDEVLIALDKAVRTSYYGYRIKDILPSIAKLHMQLWVGRDVGKVFVVLTKLITHPRGKELNVWAVGGEGYIKNVAMVTKRLEAFARAEQCKWMTYYTERKGWARICSAFAKKKYELWMKEL